MKIVGQRMFLEFCIMSMNSIQIKFPIIFDLIRGLLILTVLLISANVLNFANLYMEDEVYLKRFTFLVLLFIGSIGALIFIPHLTALLLG